MATKFTEVGHAPETPIRSEINEFVTGGAPATLVVRRLEPLAVDADSSEDSAMPLFPYNFPVPCYHTDDIMKYSPAVAGPGMDVFKHVSALLPPASADRHCVIHDGSFSIIGTSSPETIAKIVMYQRRVGNWLQGTTPPIPWYDGVYIWVRADDASDSAQAFETAANDPSFAYGWALNRFVRNPRAYAAVSVARPDFRDEHFYYFPMVPGEATAPIAEFLAFCSTL